MRGAGHDLHWKRIHQLAIVVVCPEHGCDLFPSTVSPGQMDNVLRPADAGNCPVAAVSVIPGGATVDRAALLELARGARALMAGEFPDNASPEKARGLAQMFRDLGYRRGGRIDWELLGPEVRKVVAGIAPVLPGLDRAGMRDDGWFDHAMKPVRTCRSDRVLLAAMILDRIEWRERRFWAVIDRESGRPLMELPDAA